LEDKEMEQLWSDYRRFGCEEARAEILSRHSRMVAALAARLSPSRELLPDLYQEGMVALIKCVDQFDPDRGVKFSSYAFHRVRGAMINFLVRNEFRFPRTVEEERISCILEERELEELERRLEEGEIRALLERLPPKEGEVMRSWYVLGMDPKQIAERLGVALSYVYRLRAKALAALRRMLEEG